MNSCSPNQLSVCSLSKPFHAVLFHQSDQQNHPPFLHHSPDLSIQGGEAGLGSADDEVEGVRGNDLETKTTYRGGRRRGGGKGSREGIVGDEGRNVGFGSVDDAVEDVRGNAGEGRRGGRGGRGRRGGRGSREGIVREVEGVDGLVNASGCGSRGSVA